MTRFRLLPVLITALLGGPLFSQSAREGAPAPAAPAPAVVDEEKERLIYRYLEVTGALRFYPDLVEKIIAMYQKRYPQIEKDFWVDFKKNHTTRDDFFGRIVPIYARYYSAEDLKNILAFFESPAGKKYTAVLGDLAVEVGHAAQDFEKDLNSRILKRLKEAGY